ncbi:hypothetical protein PV08_07883 [Exophiala spinifera]|uniref:Uncharacterized protein n=1 Tax=Exophiala spinifera TaxID=91928 RepID=A0A0D1YJF8_9EURO|nr:uncharacterized protein PV08_07883 [Exophiala spinifera]KIW15096.1 hypothetical protein PV08_07883 [Exophiala spinifera]
MKWTKSATNKVALTLLAADMAMADLPTVVEPCPEATSLSIPPVTVTAQYQPISTCAPTTVCVKGTCATKYPLTAFPFVSTVVPFAWNGTTSQLTTVTDIAQPVRASEFLTTLTQVTAAPSLDKRSWVDWFKEKSHAPQSTTLYQTVTRRAMVPYKEIGPLCIPEWEGSGLCEKCEGKSDGSRSQLLDVTECRSGVNVDGKAYEKCVEWYETIIERPAPTSTVTARALCSSEGKIPHAGVYTWTFPQVAPPVTITAPPTTVTVTVKGRPSLHVIPKEVKVIPGKAWNAYVTKSFSGPTTFQFNVYITKVIIFNVPWFTQPAGNTRHIPVPTGGHGGKGRNWWPLPEPSKGGSAGQAWEDWNSVSSTTTSVTSTGGPISQTTSSSSSSSSSSSTSTTSNGSGPTGASTSSSSSSSAASSSSSSSSSAASSSSSSSSSAASSSSSSSSSAASSSSSTSSSSSSAAASSSSSSSSSSSAAAGSSSSSSSSSTSASSTTTPVPTGTGFVLQVSASPVANVKRQETVTRYLAFDSNQVGFAVEARVSAAIVFQGTEGSFISEGQFLGTTRLDTSFIRRLATVPLGFRFWSVVFGFARLDGTTGFCLSDNGRIFAYVAPDTCSSPIVLIPTPIDTASSTSSSASSTQTSSLTSTASSTTGVETTSTSTSSTTEAETTSTSASAASSTTEAETTSTSASAASTTTGAETTSAASSSAASTSESSSTTDSETTSTSTTGAETTSAASSSAASTTASTTEASSTTDAETTSTSTTGAETTSVASTSGAVSSSSTSAAESSSTQGSTTTFTSTASTTSSAPATTSTSGAPICNINANICLDSDLIQANIVATENCPLLGGLTCTLNDLLSLVPALLGSSPNVLTVIAADNQVLGLDISPEQVQAALVSGTLNQVCSALGTVSVTITDPTCPAPPASSSTSSTAAASSSTSAGGNGASSTSAGASSTSAGASSTSASASTSSAGAATTSAATTTANGGATSSASSTSATPTPTCGLQVSLCAGQTLEDVGLNEVTCDTGISGVLCSVTQVLEAALNDCVGDCAVYGQTGTLGVDLNPIIGLQSIQSIQAAVANYPNCQPGGPTVTLSEPTCPVTLLKRNARKARYMRRY